MSSDFLINVFLVSLWCWGFYDAFKEGEMFGGIGKLMRKTLPEWVSKPTFDCAICMASVHGTIWFLILDEWSFLPWILFIVAVSGLNYCLAKIQFE